MLNWGKIGAEETAELKAEHKVPMFRWISPDGKDEAVITPIPHPLYARVRKIIQGAEAEGKPSPIEVTHKLLFTSCVLRPLLSQDQIDALPIGVVPSVVKSIQEKSYLIDVDIFGRVLAPDTRTTVLKDFSYWDPPSDEVKAELAEKFKSALYPITIGKFKFVIRPISRLDVRVALQADDDQLALAQAIVVYPDEVPWGEIPIGVLEKLGTKAYQLSGWQDEAIVEPL